MYLIFCIVAYYIHSMKVIADVFIFIFFLSLSFTFERKNLELVNMKVSEQVHKCVFTDEIF